MSEQLIQFAQNYLSTIQNLNILLATASGLAIYHCKQYRCLFFVSLVFTSIGIMITMHSYESLLDYLLVYKPDILSNPKSPYKYLSYAFWLQLLALVFLAIGAWFNFIHKGSKE